MQSLWRAVFGADGQLVSAGLVVTVVSDPLGDELLCAVAFDLGRVGYLLVEPTLGSGTFSGPSSGVRVCLQWRDLLLHGLGELHCFARVVAVGDWLCHGGVAVGGQWIAVAALVSALQVLTATPEITIVYWLMLGILWMAAVISRQVKPGVAAGRFAGVILLAAGITMVQMLPFFDLLAHSQRDTTKAESFLWAMPGWGWANLFVPLFHTYRAPPRAVVPAGSGFSGVLLHRGGRHGIGGNRPVAQAVADVSHHRWHGALLLDSRVGHGWFSVRLDLENFSVDRHCEIPG